MRIDSARLSACIERGRAIGPLALVVAAVVCLQPGLRAAGSLFSSSPPRAEHDAFAATLDDYHALHALSVSRVLGRSAFEAPAPPPDRTPPRVKAPAPREEKPALRPAPEAYDGPLPSGYLRTPAGVRVTFGTFALGEGDTAGELTLVSAVDPDHIRLRVTRPGHETREYAISMWPATLSSFDDVHEPGIERGSSR
ncbi:MAG: hypothetical protein JNM94_13695 [Phycisphaerae bacterium]|nr:hypothetical protein [Phycisphaerae bacterium]